MKLLCAFAIVVGFIAWLHGSSASQFVKTPGIQRIPTLSGMVVISITPDQIRITELINGKFEHEFIVRADTQLEREQ